MSEKNIEVEEQKSSSTEVKKQTRKTLKENTVKTLSEVSEERTFEITTNVLGFKNEYYTLLNPRIKSKTTDKERIEFLEKLLKLKMIKEI